ncbi:haloacid dehalogenase type II [Salinarimonas ramus]|uniref:(S)-2-haloacid dehalogenase n=1 Tax=Salinarimonas ramus TaxID=690164 RepID=A0A917V4R4_9HYPH|nr:haloacid dehalogenase type II [Salinarimonas ramus]GGK37520.1 haloacid dehalogenase [Salinarimonas ramus]
MPNARSVVVFDAFGTLFDVHSAVARNAASIGPASVHLSEIWRAKQLEYTWTLSLMGRYEPFWRLTERALDQALARSPEVDPVVRDTLLTSYRALDAYPEVPGTLARLKARGARTAILSNGDEAMLADAVASAGIGGAFDAVLSVDRVRVFKTDPRTYALVEQEFGCGREDVLFVSSNRWDVAGAVAFGFEAAWVNRAGVPDEYADLAAAMVVGTLDAIR